MIRTLAALCTLLAALTALPAIAQEESGPRYATLRADEVNMRTGPGLRYPIDWVYRRAGWPVRVLAEFDVWRKVRDPDGIEGWVHQRMLSSRRGTVIQGEIRLIRQQPLAAAPILARAEPRVVARLEGCEGGWCEIEAAGYRGWVEAAALWGTD